jgi:hypothetical protein
VTEASSPTPALAELATSYRWDAVAPDVRERVLFAVRDALAERAAGSVGSPRIFVMKAIALP